MKTDDKKMLLTSLFLMMSLLGMAATVDLQEAQARATAFLFSHQHARMAPAPYSAPLRTLHAEPSTVNPSAMDYYVFQAGDDDDAGAFVIVAGDDRADVILGYGDGPLDMKDLPCGMQWLLDYYKEQMEWLLANPTAVIAREPSYASSTGVDPLLTCNWDQGEPYYNQCPVFKNQHCLTGCIATAMAQVMYYWKYPDHLPDYPAYVTDNIVVEALPGTSLDWDEMLDGYYLFDGYYKMQYTEAQAEAVATLMRYCGQASRMGYGISGSGAYTWNQMTAMSDFGYNLGCHIEHRDRYTTDEWREMLLAELNANRPILYSGASEDLGGHAFVVDGYDGFRFHINWGWEGNANGFFAIDAFSAYGVYGFNNDQRMVADLYPGTYNLPYDVEVDGICYRRNGNELTVVSKAERDNTYRGNITIPSHVTIDGVDCTVTAIGNSAFKNCTSLRAITLPETVKRIDKYAFKGCKALTTVTLPAGLEYIGLSAFHDCTRIQALNLGSGLKHISSYAFFNCRGLKQLNIPHTMESIDREAFLVCLDLNTLTIDMECVPDWSFYTCTSLRTVKLGKHVKTVGTGAFRDCTSMTELNFGPNVDSIAPLAFNGCTSLTAIRHLPEVPPLAADEECFSEETYSRATLYVPESTWLDYYSCDVWTLFENQVIEPATLPGDANLDGAVNIADVNLVINDILSGTMTEACDANGDGSVNIADVNFIIGCILGAQ